MQVRSLSLVYSFLKTLFNFKGFRIFKAAGLLLISSFFQGFSLLMLIPLLGLTGISSTNKSSDSISTSLNSFLSSFNISYTLISILSLFLFLIILEAVFTRYRTIVLNNLNLDFTNHLRNSLYRLIANSNWQFQNRNHSSKSMHLLDNAVTSIGSCTYYVLQLSVYITQAIVFLLIASSLSIPMTLIMVLTGIILFALIRPINKKVFKHGKQAVKTNQILYKNMVEFFGGLKLAKSYNRTEQHTKQFKKTGENLLTDEKAVTAASSLAQMWLRIFTVSLLCIFVYIALAILHINIERLLVLIILVNRLYGLFSNSQSNWQGLLQEIPNFVIYQEAHLELRNNQESPQDNINANFQIKSELRLDDISFNYEDNTESSTLSNISISFPVNKTTAIIGPSGAGKSTLVDLIIGLLTPDSGKIYADTKELTKNDLFSLRKHIAYVPQEVYLFDGTIRSNLQWISDQVFDDQQMWDALDAAAASDFIRKLPQQLDTQIGERGVKLSGGERQRIALARALLKKPDLLILDEATSSLDNENEERIRDALDNLHGSMMIIIIAHRNSTIQHADFIVLLDKGLVKTSGDWSQIRKQ